jgi:hypothetical protein
MAEGTALQVYVTYATPQDEFIHPMRVAPGTTIGQAIERSGVLARFPDINLVTQPVGIYGKKKTLDTVCATATASRSTGRWWPTRRIRGASARPRSRQRPDFSTAPGQHAPHLRQPARLLVVGYVDALALVIHVRDAHARGQRRLAAACRRALFGVAGLALRVLGRLVLGRGALGRALRGRRRRGRPGTGPRSWRSPRVQPAPWWPRAVSSGCATAACRAAAGGRKTRACRGRRSTSTGHMPSGASDEGAGAQ